MQKDVIIPTYARLKVLIPLRRVSIRKFAFSKLTHTETDLVLRGDFAGGSVDSDVKITTLYVQCPVDVNNTATGFLRAAAHFNVMLKLVMWHQQPLTVKLTATRLIPRIRDKLKLHLHHRHQ